VKQQKTQNRRANANNEESCSTPQHCPIVAMGASAGGLEVFQRFFDAMPPDAGMAFVLVQHLDRSHETLMPEILSKHTKMPVSKVEEGLKVQANHVYVIAPSTSLTMDACTFRLRSKTDGKPIDQFFKSVAADQQESVIGIVFSGTGSDGTLGLKAIKEHGGLTMAQIPDTAKFDSMPRNAISSGFVDYVLAVEEIPARIVEYVRHLNVLQQRKSAETIQQEAVRLLPKIFPILKKKTSHDFSRYKQSTLARRIQRRMQVAYLDSVSKYVNFLRESPHEVDALFKDLLIGVTQFFRDSESFEVLAMNVIPTLFEGKKKDNIVRLWVPGCSSGEEAYSFAILLAEHAAELDEAPKIQVFATDLDAEALEFARKARYSEDIAEQISPGRLRRFFKKTGSVYEVVDEIREMCIFSPHNLIKDPPFSRLDLISCRNLLIYLEVDLQRRLLPLFHYALNPCGYLFLGPSENVASRSELFRAVDQKHRIFQRKPTLLHSPIHVPLMDSGQVTRFQTLASPSVSLPKEQNLARSIERVILEEYAPASAVINQQAEVLYFSGNTGKFLEPASGVPSNKIISMARKNLRLELRSAIHRAISTGKEVVRESIAFKSGREVQQIDLIVRPLPEVGKEAELFIVIFRELIPGTGISQPAEDFADHENPIIKQLENELRTTKDDLQTTIEELETSNEELKSANEELLSMNEELQSGNEELQTSKEEVQSANDELQRKIEEVETANLELKQAHEDRARLAAIVQNSDDAIISKTLDSIITSWNRAAERIFGYTADEIIGKSILTIIPPERSDEETHIISKLKRGERIQHYETVRLTKDGRRIIASITASPIRDANGFIIGASKIARDITEQRKNQEALQRREKLLSDFFENGAIGLHWVGPDGIILRANRTEMALLGYSPEEYIGHNIAEFYVDLPIIEDILHKLTCGETLDNYEARMRCKDGSVKHVLVSSNVFWEEGKFIHSRCFTRDITEQKKAEAALQKAKEDLERRVEERTASLRETTEQLETFCYTIAHDLRSPLRAQQSFAQVLLEDYKDKLDETGLNYLQRILASAGRLDKLVNDLLAYSRISRSEILSREIDLGKVVGEVQGHLADDIQNQKGRVTVGPLLSVCAYEPTLHLVITNLMANALKFVAPGATPDIHIWSEEKDSFVRLWVEDKGIGISPEHIEKIFGVFQRLHPMDKYPGTGIGLAIVRKGVERLGGRVGVESEPGKGSRFWIELKKPGA
jgi:two-component system CheB/CheR fusion protein